MGLIQLFTPCLAENVTVREGRSGSPKQHPCSSAHRSPADYHPVTEVGSSATGGSAQKRVHPVLVSDACFSPRRLLPRVYQRPGGPTQGQRFSLITGLLWVTGVAPALGLVGPLLCWAPRSLLAFNSPCSPATQRR